MLYLITNRRLIKSGSLYDTVENAIKGGVDRVILREKDLSYEELLPIAVRLKSITDAYKVPLIINDNIRVAKSIKSEGFHIRFKKLKEESYNFNGILGISVHSIEEALEAEKYGADYLLAGHIFATDCKKSLEPKGIKLIEDIKEKVRIPIIGLGGINHTNATKVICAGADGIAVMSYIMTSEKPYDSAKRLKNLTCRHQ